MPSLTGGTDCCSADDTLPLTDSTCSRDNHRTSLLPPSELGNSERIFETFEVIMIPSEHVPAVVNLFGLRIRNHRHTSASPGHCMNRLTAYRSGRPRVIYGFPAGKVELDIDCHEV